MKIEDQIIFSISNIHQKSLDPIIDCCETGPLEEHLVLLTTEQSLQPSGVSFFSFEMTGILWVAPGVLELTL